MIQDILRSAIEENMQKKKKGKKSTQKEEIIKGKDGKTYKQKYDIGTALTPETPENYKKKEN